MPTKRRSRRLRLARSGSARPDCFCQLETADGQTRRQTLYVSCRCLLASLIHGSGRAFSSPLATLSLTQATSKGRRPQFGSCATTASPLVSASLNLGLSFLRPGEPSCAAALGTLRRSLV